MRFEKRATLFALGMLLFAGALACQVTDTFIAQATVVPTRTPRPTFTPIPPPSPTVIPTAIPPTQPPPPTVKPTLRPTVRPPTAKPVAPPVAPPPVAPPAPTVSPYQYGTANLRCEHSGGQYIKGKVYDSQDSSAGGVSGMKMALGGAGGTDPWVTTMNFDDGVYSFTLSPDGGPYKPAGTYYIWIIDGNGKRISDVGGPININPVGPDAAGTCWAGSVDFWKRY